ncbi:UNVERIFIED_CONTAM: hypothetical protein K2H54_024937 [Gekko kuhli]
MEGRRVWRTGTVHFSSRVVQSPEFECRRGPLRKIRQHGRANPLLNTPRDQCEHLPQMHYLNPPPPTTTIPAAFYNFLNLLHLYLSDSGQSHTTPAMYLNGTDSIFLPSLCNRFTLPVCECAPLPSPDTTFLQEGKCECAWEYLACRCNFLRSPQERLSHGKTSLGDTALIS